MWQALAKVEQPGDWLFTDEWSFRDFMENKISLSKREKSPALS